MLPLLLEAGSGAWRGDVHAPIVSEDPEGFLRRHHLFEPDKAGSIDSVDHTKAFAETAGSTKDDCTFSKCVHASLASQQPLFCL